MSAPRPLTEIIDEELGDVELLMARLRAGRPSRQIGMRCRREQHGLCANKRCRCACHAMREERRP